MLIYRFHFDFESCFVSRWTYPAYLCNIRGPVTNRPPTHSILDQPSFDKFFTHVFMLALDTSQYQALHDLINITVNPDSILHIKM